MEKSEIKCYLCGNEANQIEHYNMSPNVRVSCQKCMEYELTEEAIRFYLRRPNGKELLNQKDKRKLSEYIRKHYDLAKRSAVLIDTKIIEAVTGKMSVHEI